MTSSMIFGRAKNPRLLIIYSDLTQKMYRVLLTQRMDEIQVRGGGGELNSDTENERYPDVLYIRFGCTLF